MAIQYKRLHFIGIGGIGMSGLASMALEYGIAVSGSDRALERQECRQIFDTLRQKGAKIYPQDGSFAKDGMPDAVIYSTAIEADNPDLNAAGDLPRLHRSELLKYLMGQLPESCDTIAVTGSCGKSTITANVAMGLKLLGVEPDCLNGALVKEFKTTTEAGNYHKGQQRFFVFEADESDKSLLHYQVDYAVILNFGTDHFQMEELVNLFADFLKNVRKGAILGRPVQRELERRHLLPSNISVVQVTDSSRRVGLEAQEACLRKACAAAGGSFVTVNRLITLKTLQMLGFNDSEALAKAVSQPPQVWRRQEHHGIIPGTIAEVYDDYAHNPEKILAFLQFLRSKHPGRRLIIFQPHGYGPWGFMEQQLYEYIESELRYDEYFYVMEPYYAGGTSKFHPTAAEVVKEWQRKSLHPESFIVAPKDRAELRKMVIEEAKKHPTSTLGIMGARDNSLSDFAASFTKEE